MNREAMELSRDFLNLPYVYRERIMREMGMIDPKAGVVISHSLWRECFRRVRELGRIAELQAAVTHYKREL